MDAASRARLYEEVFAAVVASRTTLSAYLMPDLERARYTMGTSMADRVLPYVLEDSIRVVFRPAQEPEPSAAVHRHEMGHAPDEARIVVHRHPGRAPRGCRHGAHRRLSE